jgi:hypothetical protein
VICFALRNPPFKRRESQVAIAIKDGHPFTFAGLRENGHYAYQHKSRAVDDKSRADTNRLAELEEQVSCELCVQLKLSMHR